jgi:hypothetical protein
LPQEYESRLENAEYSANANIIDVDLNYIVASKKT